MLEIESTCEESNKSETIKGKVLEIFELVWVGHYGDKEINNYSQGEDIIKNAGTKLTHRDEFSTVCH